MVRCGIAVYGLDPFRATRAEHGLEPALELHSYVADVKRFERGRAPATAGPGGRRRTPGSAVLPIGYGDGVRRGLSNNGEVLVGGRRYPLVGTVSMDNITIDLGPETDVEPGAPAVLIGAQGGERILAEEMARAARDDQLRGHLRDLAAGAAGVPGMSASSGAHHRRARGALRRRPAVEVARSGLREVSDRAWIVGGAIRDALARQRRRGRRPGGRRRRAEAARGDREGGRRAPFELSEEHATWRASTRRRLARRRRRSARRDDRGRPARARLHRQRDRGAARGRRADRPDRRARATSRPAPPRLRPSAPSATTRSGCSRAARLAAAASGSRSSRGRPTLARARRRRGPPSRPGSASSPSSPGSSRAGAAARARADGRARG